MDNINTWDREKYIRAWMFATKHHSGQKYGGNQEGEYVDYINHIGMVTMEVLWALQNSKQAYDADLAVQCAILHDTIEDTGVSFDDIKSDFGEQVANGVMALSKNGDLSTKAEQMSDSLGRIKQQPKEVWMVKLADRISNLDHPPFYWDDSKKQKYLNEARKIYDLLHEANGLLSQRLQEKIQTYMNFLMP